MFINTLARTGFAVLRLSSPFINKQATTYYHAHSALSAARFARTSALWAATSPKNKNDDDMTATTMETKSTVKGPAIMKKSNSPQYFASNTFDDKDDDDDDEEDEEDFDFDFDDAELEELQRLEHFDKNLKLQDLEDFEGLDIKIHKASDTQKMNSNWKPSIDVYNQQTTLANIDEEKLKTTLTEIKSLLGYPNYGVTLALIEDEEMQQINLESRNENKPTDILSFPFHEAIEPGILHKPEFDIPDEYILGDLLVDVPYILRRIQEDKEEAAADSEEEDDDDRGVSKAMATEFDPEKRIHMLLIHGMLHLVGYDHETDHEFEQMVSKEEEMLKQLDF